MNEIELIRHYQKMSMEEFNHLLENKKSILDLSFKELNILFLNINSECKKKMLDDLEIFTKILNIPPNRMKKTILDLIDEEMRNYIYNHPNLLSSKDSLPILKMHLQKLSNEEISQLLKNENLNLALAEDYIQEINKKFELTPLQYASFKQEVLSNQFPNIALVTIKSREELFIFTKFHILVSISQVEDNYIIIDTIALPLDFLEKVNRKHINSLLELAKKYNEDITNNKLFITIIKLYMIFGLDNSKKILNNFFTFATEASIKRASEELFKDLRREYRLLNQEQYYFYGLEVEFEEALYRNDEEYFRKFCARDRQYTLELIQRAKERLKNGEDVKNIILEEINTRENYFHDLDIKRYNDYYQRIARTEKITILDLYKTFAATEVKYNLTDDGKIIPDDYLTKVLLGNCKKDNDCLLRMVFNEEALGINHELYQIINYFDRIKEIIEIDRDLSVYSILDIIDISKVFLYHLKPDELDITLETLSKILNSRKYCTEEPEVILKRVLTLHKKRKQKISCAIPFLKGNFQDIKYNIILPYEESLLVCGIDTGSCLKVGGKGEDFFEFCLTSPLGLILRLEYQEREYILPCSVNGNMLNINSIDPRISDEETYNHLLKAIQEFSNQLLKVDSTIEIVTMTDIHHIDFMNHTGLEPIEIDEFIPLNTSNYNDYNKKEVTNYIIAKRDIKSIPKYFNNSDRFYQERRNPYIFSPTCEYDKERIEIILNQIAYSSINFMEIDDNEKDIQRMCYQNLEIDDFIYIVGNIDWFIGIDKNNHIIECILPYDQRALEEFQKYRYILEESLKKGTFLTNILKK